MDGKETWKRCSWRCVSVRTFADWSYVGICDQGQVPNTEVAALVEPQFQLLVSQ